MHLIKQRDRAGSKFQSSLALYHDKTLRFEIVRNLTRRAIESEAGCIWARLRQRPQDLMFTGGYGVGKTHLAAAIANYQAMRGYPAMFVVVPDCSTTCARPSPDARTSSDQRFEEAARLYCWTNGHGISYAAAREKLYQIINHRYVENCPR
jgi:chromosomal replication initiation ATPase DnaA